MAPRLVVPWCVLLFAARLGAQGGDVPRQVHPGRVVDADGKPVAEARVTFVSAPRLGAEPDDDDVVRATTGADGRFRVQLVPSRAYRAWAAIVRGEQALVSGLVLRKQGATELQLEREVMPLEREVRIEGAALWREHGPLRVQVVVEGGRMVVPEAEVGADGVFRVPPLPRVAMPCRVFARDRLVSVSPEAPLGTPLVLPTPWLVPVRVVDAQGGAIAEATLSRGFLGASTQWAVFPIAPQLDEWPLAFTGADGCCEVLVAFGEDPRRVPMPNFGMMASRTGFGTAAATQWVDGRLEFVLKRSAPAAARGWPAPTCRARLVAPDLPRGLIVGASASVDDAIGAPSAPGRGKTRFVYVSSHAFERGPDDPFARSIVPMPVLLPASMLEEAVPEPRDVVPLRLQLLDPTGGPAAQAQVCLSPLADRRFLDFRFALRATTDEAGRVVVPCAVGGWMLVSCREGGVVAQRIDVGRGMAPAELRMKALPCMRVRATRGIGKAAADVRFELAHSVAFAGGSAEDNCLLEVALQVTAWALQQVRTDADGRVDLPVFERPPLQLQVRVVGERDAVPMTLAPGEAIVPLVVK